MKLLLKLLGFAILWYCCFAYVLLEANPFKWSQAQRFDFTLLLICISLGVVANDLISDKNETR